MACVLVVDDDHDIRQLVTYKLARCGHEVTAVADGRAALRAVREMKVDVILLDVIMPEMSGLDVLRELRADPATANIPVIMLTARTQEADVELGFARGADAYITKPFNLKELEDGVQAVLSRAEE